MFMLQLYSLTILYTFKLAEMAMGEEMWLRDGWEIPGSDDEMEYDLAKCIDSKLTACFDALT